MMDGWWMDGGAFLTFPGCLVNQTEIHFLKMFSSTRENEDGFWDLKRKIKHLTDGHESPSEYLFIVQKAIKAIR